MTSAKLHHVAFRVRPESHERAGHLWRDLELSFEETPVVDERLSAFPDEHGDGEALSVRTADVAAPIEARAGHGASARYQHHGGLGNVVVEHADLTPVFGMAITLLATNLQH
jgi:hypothetical protein